ncbi:hypothetical protein M3672_09135 [Microbacterium enclense]|uniref:hypothetical protein n=1 Tax=Microbacterium enclense TaxID=993073 RepID=UPI00203DA4FA|nr:hypothetical protein [Microbacterium enclense]MCM3614599.1 hypothetical protein [Microbacterium enclense]
MTTTYQLAPYVVWIKPTRSQGDIRPLDDIDANGLTMRDLIARTLTGAMGNSYSLPKKPDVGFRVSDVRVGNRSLYFEVSAGSRGVESEIALPDEASGFSRTVNHVENVKFRHLVVFPKGGTHAVLLAERIGVGGVSSFVGRLLKDTIQENVPGSLFTMNALLSAAELRQIPIMVNSVSFEFPQHRDEQGRLSDVGAAAGKLNFRLKLTRARKLDGFTKGKGKDTKIDPELIYGVIDEALSQAGFGFRGRRLMQSKGVKAKVGVELPSGNKRSFTLGEREGPALVYPLGTVKSADAADEERHKPGDDVLVSVARDIVTDVRGSYGVKRSTADDCVLPDSHDPIEVPKDWKVVWRVPDHTDASSS